VLFALQGRLRECCGLLVCYSVVRERRDNLFRRPEAHNEIIKCRVDQFITGRGQYRVTARLVDPLGLIVHLRCRPSPNVRGPDRSLVNADPHPHNCCNPVTSSSDISGHETYQITENVK